jgi:hypothetical protein
MLTSLEGLDQAAQTSTHTTSTPALLLNLMGSQGMSIAGQQAQTMNSHVIDNPALLNGT